MFSLLNAALGISLIATSAPETVWWRTPGAAVVQDGPICSLFFYTKPQAVVFAWNAGGIVSVTFQDQRFHFDTEVKMPIGVRIDENYLTDDLVGTGSGNLFTVPLKQSIDDLLPHAATIEVKAANDQLGYEVTVPLLTAKMPVLLTALKKCRGILKFRH